MIKRKKRTRLIILSGFLGSGKTTLLCHIINNTNQKIAVLMNEFGKIGIDTETIQKENIAVKELLEGCVCCSLQGEFEAAVTEIITLYHPEMIIVETTGIAEADNLVLGIDESIKEVILEAVITVVDADALVRFPAMSGNLRIQIESADILILNKIDLVKASQVKELMLALQKVNSRAPIIITSYAQVDLDVLFSTEVGIHRGQHTISKHNFHHSFETFTLDSPDFSKRKLISCLQKLPASVYRLKGHVKSGAKFYLLNYVGGRFSFEEEKGTLKLVFIGNKINVDKVKIKKLFRNI